MTKDDLFSLLSNIGQPLQYDRDAPLLAQKDPGEALTEHDLEVYLDMPSNDAAKAWLVTSTIVKSEFSAVSTGCHLHCCCLTSA